MVVTVVIGNSDNNLTQQEWSKFVNEVNCEIRQRYNVHFFGSPPTISPWQNAAWVFEGQHLDNFKARLTLIRIKYKQKSIAFIEGQTEFL